MRAEGGEEGRKMIGGLRGDLMAGGGLKLGKSVENGENLARQFGRQTLLPEESSPPLDRQVSFVPSNKYSYDAGPTKPLQRKPENEMQGRFPLDNARPVEQQLLQAANQEGCDRLGAA